jgi:hypothetical protein
MINAAPTQRAPARKRYGLVESAGSDKDGRQPDESGEFPQEPRLEFRHAVARQQSAEQ